MVNKQINRGIQILRVIACLAVFFCHFGQRLKLNRFSDNLYGFSQLGRYGVELFFVISGYLVCFSLLNGKSAIQFYKKRIIRILPLYYFSILVFFITESFIFRDVPKDDMHLGWLRYIFCLNGIVPSEGYFWSNIGITWTIPVFLMFYILAPFIMKVAKSTFSSAIVLVISIGFSLIINLKFHGWLSGLTFMPCFLMGVLVYNAKKENLIFATLIGLQLFVFLSKFCSWTGFISKAVNGLELFVVSAIFATIIIASDEFKITDNKIIKMLDVLDDHSYTLYLVHGITFCAIIDKFDINTFGNTRIFLLFRLAVSIIGTGILTVLVHKYVEKPIQNRLISKAKEK